MRPTSTDRLPGPLALAVAAGWFALAVGLARSGFFRTWAGLGPLSAVQVAIVAPPTAFGVAYAALPSLRAWTRALDPTFLTAVQVLRILGSAHLVYWGAGIMAGVFALCVGTGNLLVAGLALYTVPRVARRDPGWRTRLLAVTILGIAEFLMTIGLAVAGLFAAPTPWDPPVSPAGLMPFTRLPLSVFPTYLIPLFLTIHVATLLRLRGASADD